MLYDMSWLQTGKAFPPASEQPRIERYIQNAALFDGDHFADSHFRHRDGYCAPGVNVYLECARRITRIVGNFEDIISFPVLINFQKLLSLKMADLIMGEYPTITVDSEEGNTKIKDKRLTTDFDSKLYSGVIDISRYGDAIIRIYKDEQTKENTFTMWDPTEWFPVVSQDGTNTILKHCLCWMINLEPDPDKAPDWRLHVQVHDVMNPGSYTEDEYKMDKYHGVIGSKVGATKTVLTGLDKCAVMHLKSFTVTNSVYGYDDYMGIDSILAEIMVRIGQISKILDKHAQPSMTGPVSMLSTNVKTGEKSLKRGSFYAISPGETPPSYLTWEGNLEAAFKELEVLLNLLYIMSETGATLIGDSLKGNSAISGTAFRFSMSSPLEKARRISNSLTRPVKELFSILLPEIDVNDISVKWADGLPDDPREVMELIKLATGKTSILPLSDALMEYLNKSQKEASAIVSTLEEEARKSREEMFGATSQQPGEGDDDPNKPGPQDGTGVNPQKKGSDKGLNNFKSDTNKKDGK